MSTLLLQQLEHMLATWSTSAATATRTHSDGGDAGSNDALTTTRSALLPHASPTTLLRGNDDSDSDSSRRRASAAGAAVVTSSPRTVAPVSLLPTYRTTTTDNNNNDDDVDDDAAVVSDMRRAVTRLELARAALALFASNAGVFRGVLVRLLRFVFALVDHLVDERSRAHLTRERAQASPHATSTTTTTTTASADTSDASTTLSSNDAAVARAYAAVRRVEAKMATLVDEAAVQRDRLQAQLAAQAQHVAKLEQLLQHQMTLTDALLQQQQRGVTTTTATTASALPSSHNDDSDAYDGARVVPVKHDAAYVRHLVARAAREHAVAELETRVRALAVDHAQAQQRVDALLRLNGRYAQQAIELSARLSVLRDHNVALAADAQLYQRDALLERQRADKLSREVAAARAALLVWLETRQREVQLVSVATAQARRARQRSSVSTTVRQVAAAAATAAANAAQGSDDDDARDMTEHDDATTTAACLVEHTDHALRDSGDTALRQQLQHILCVKDGDVGGAMKTALLSLLNVRRTSLMTTALVDGDDSNNDNTSRPRCSALDEAAAAQAAEAEAGLRALQLQLRGGHVWAVPRGCDAHVPLHLRTRTCVPLLHFHALVAECVVHELLVQRREFVTYYSTPDELQRAIRAALSPGSGGSGSGATMTTVVSTRNDNDNDNNNTTCVDVPLDVFVDMFIRVVWLSDDKRGSVLSTMTMQAPPQLSSAAPPASLSSRLRAALLTSSSTATSTLAAARVQTSRELPLEGLKLSYGLDAASRRSDAGVLTHVYGLMSRHELSEVVLEVMRSERALLLALCAAAEQQHVHSIEHTRDHSNNDNNNDGDVHTTTSEQAATAAAVDAARVRRQGCVPTVQLARILALMYPGYSYARLEQLVQAASEDGASDAERPVMVYYTVLLPERQLPSAAAHETATAASDRNNNNNTTPSEWWQCGRFASLFYKSICDDALESLQLLDDSLCAFARRKHDSSSSTTHTGDGDEANVNDDNSTAPTDAAAGSAARQDASAEHDAASRAAALQAAVQQWCVLALDGVPWHELQYWGGAVRAVMLHWASHATATATAATGVDTTTTTTMHGGSDDAAWQTPVQQLMRYLRRHVLPRRGPLPPPQTAAALSPAHDTATTAMTATTHSNNNSDNDDSSDKDKVLVAAEHAAYIQTLEQRWRHFCHVAQPMSRRRGDAASAAASVSPALASLSQLAALMHAHDGQRELVWGTPHVAACSHLIRTDNVTTTTTTTRAAAATAALACDVHAATRRPSSTTAAARPAEAAPRTRIAKRRVSRVRVT